VTKEEYYQQGMDYFAEEKVDEAIQSYQKALKEDPSYADALHALAMTYAAKDLLDDAIEVGKKLIEVSPEDELAYTSLSIFYQRKGMIEEAEHIGAKARTLGWKLQFQEKKETEKK